MSFVAETDVREYEVIGTAHLASHDPTWQPDFDIRRSSVFEVDSGETATLGAASTADPLFVDVYERLKAMASRQRFRGGAPRTVCTTELVHEAYLRMSASDNRYEHPAHFFAYAARVMRHVLTDAARHRAQPKRGGDQARVALSDPLVDSVQFDPHLALQLDAALGALELDDPRAAQVVELHYFAGLELQEVAALLRVTRRTIDRDWRYARAFMADRADAA
jgi:RNA polymerase sigma factor (TIGR02999 family)